MRSLGVSIERPLGFAACLRFSNIRQQIMLCVTRGAADVILLYRRYIEEGYHQECGRGQDATAVVSLARTQRQRLWRELRLIPPLSIELTNC